MMQGKALFSTVTALTCISFLLIGYDNGVFGGLVGQAAFQGTFPDLTPTILGTIVSIYDVGCFCGAVLCAFIGENLGRCRTLSLGGVIMLIGALLQATAYGVPHMIVARIVSGIGMGLINSTAPVYQSEFSPKGSRGMWACAMLSTLNFGIFLSYWITYGFAGQEGSYAWRIPVILQAVFIIPIIVLPFILPESPRWLVKHDRVDEALSVLQRLEAAGNRENAQETVAAIQASYAAERTLQVGLFTMLLKGDDIKSRRRLFIAMGIQFFQQLGGINGIIYYAGTIFASIGFDSHTAALISGLLFTWFLVASFIPWFLIDRVGRRPLFLSCISIMACVFAVMAGMAKQIDEQTNIAKSASIVAASMLFLYMGCFTIGFQATVWVYPPEILPLTIRARGTSLATAANWITNYMVVQITPIGIDTIGWRYYIIYAVFNACFVPIIYFFFPETRRLALEDVDRLFAGSEANLILDVEDKKAHNAHIEAAGSSDDLEKNNASTTIESRY